jgi:hypothetical protein
VRDSKFVKSLQLKIPSDSRFPFSKNSQPATRPLTSTYRQKKVIRDSLHRDNGFPI